MDFLYFLRVVLKRKWFILGAGILAAAIAWFFTRNEQKKYVSNAQIATGFIIKDQIKVLDDEDISFFEADARFTNAIITWKSPSVMSLLSYKLILHDLTEAKPFRVLSEEDKQSELFKKLDKEKMKKVFEQKLESMELLTSYKPEEKDLLDVLGMYGYDHGSLLGNFTINRLQRTDYINVEFISENPELSAYAVNTSFQQFLRYYRNVRDTRSIESTDTLRSIMDKKKADLDFKRSLLTGEGIINPELETTSSVNRITDLEKSLTDEKSRQTQLYYELRKVNQKLQSLNSPTPSNPNPVNNNNENGELLALKKAMDKAYEDYVNSGATDKALYNKYNHLKTEYQNKIVNSNAPGIGGGDIALPNNRAALLEKKQDLEVDVQASQANITSIEARIRGLKGSAVQDATKAASVESMMKEVDLANKEYLEAKQKYTEAIDITTSSVNNFRQVLIGQPAILPEPSKRKMTIGMAGLCAVLATIFVIVLLTYLDSSIKTPKIFSKVVNLKLISMVNFMNLKKKNLTDLVAGSVSNEDDASKRRMNIFRESLRKLRFEIENSGKKIFLFTSTKKGEGKSTLIQALAYSMSLSKKRILIIDTNFCNNDLTVRMNATPMLEKIESEQTGEEDTLQKVKHAITDVGNGYIFIIGSEGGDYTPSEILPTGHILNHLQELTAEYDYIFLEGPPLNEYSDSRELAKFVDAVIAIFSAHNIIKQIDKESIEFFKELDGKFYGSVLNKVDMENVNAT